MKAVRVTSIVAAVFLIVGGLLLATGWVWTGGVFLVIGIVILIGAFSGAGAEIGLKNKGRLASATVLSIQTERDRRGHEYFSVMFEFSGEHGVRHRGEVHILDPDEAGRIRPGMSKTIRYDPDHPSASYWPDEDEQL